MKRIHFDKLSGNWVRIGWMIASLILILTGYGILFDYENSLVSALGFLIQIIILSRIFWYKNFVQWNKKGIVIKTHVLKSKSITFEDIDKIYAEENLISLELNRGKTIEINLEHIHDTDKNNLLRILIENSRSKFTDNRTNQKS